MAEIRLTCVSGEIKRSLKNIADNTGIPLATFIKIKLSEIVESAPDKMKQPKRIV